MLLMPIQGQGSLFSYNTSFELHAWDSTEPISGGMRSAHSFENLQQYLYKQFVAHDPCVDRARRNRSDL